MRLFCVFNYKQVEVDLSLLLRLIEVLTVFLVKPIELHNLFN